MSFKVTQQFGSGRETLSQQFTTLEDAKKHALEFAEQKKSMKIDAIFRVYDMYDDVVATYDTKNLITQSKDSDDTDAGSSTGGKGQSASFRPTPLATSPRPAGMPQNWRSDPEDDKDKK